MTNYEKYQEQINEILATSDLGIRNGKPYQCRDIPCVDCDCYKYHKDKACRVTSVEWLMQDTDIVDWHTIPVDTKILVSEDGTDWHKRHFARYQNGAVYVWCYGRTSYTAVSEEPTEKPYRYAKLYEEPSHD